MDKQPLEKIESLVADATKVLGDLATNKKVLYPSVGGVVGYLVGKDSHKEVIGALIGAGIGAVVAHNTEETDED